jgi:hypothetical protein
VVNAVKDELRIIVTPCSHTGGGSNAPAKTIGIDMRPYASHTLTCGVPPGASVSGAPPPTSAPKKIQHLAFLSWQLNTTGFLL